MKALKILSFAIAVLFPLVSFGQTQQANAEAATPQTSGIVGSSGVSTDTTFASKLKVGSYDAVLIWEPTNDVYHHEITVTEISNGHIVGTVLAFNPKNSNRACFSKVALIGEIRKDGSIYLASSGSISGCERTYEIKSYVQGEFSGMAKTPSAIMPFTLVPKG